MINAQLFAVIHNFMRSEIFKLTKISHTRESNFIFSCILDFDVFKYFRIPAFDRTLLSGFNSPLQLPGHLY